MTKVLSVAQVRESEGLTMREEPISSIDLMERAGTRFAEKLINEVPLKKFSEILVICGTGNNGGDGLVIARYLYKHGCTVNVIIAATETSRRTDEFTTNLERWYGLSDANREEHTFTYEEGVPLKFTPHCLIIDAIFGIGLSKPLRGYFASLVEAINEAHQYVVAVDAPSGLPLDQHREPNQICVRADETYTFQFQKLAYLLPETYSYCGDVSLVDIGLRLPDGQFDMQCIEEETIRLLLHKPNKYAHKGSMGHGLLIAGSADMPGAAILAATSALRGGIGKVTVHSCSKVCDLLPGSIPEAILSRDRNEQCFSGIDLEKHPSINAIAVGCGLGTSTASVNGLKNLLDEVGSPLILDADALNILSENKTWLAFLPPCSILTPHIKEFERLVGKSGNDFERIEKLKQFASRGGVIVVLKGAHTAVAMPDGKVFFNTTGNPGMATAGSGDVLTGLLLSLLSQGYTPETAALLGVYLHGAAADDAAAHLGATTALIASDIPLFLGQAVKSIVSHND